MTIRVALAAQLLSSYHSTLSNQSTPSILLMSSSISVIQRYLHYIALVLKFLLSPLRKLSDLLFPLQDTDGLSARAATRAAQLFSNDPRYSKTSFAQVKQQAIDDHKLVLLILHSTLHPASKQFTTTVVPTLFQDRSMLVYGVSVQTAQGAHLAQLLHCSSYPAIVLLQPQNSHLQIVLRGEGPRLLQLTERQLQTALQAACLQYQNALAESEARRLQQQEESLLRQQQDEEYQLALQQDREREQAERLAREEQELKAKEELEAIQQEQERKEQELQRAQSVISEPPTSGGANVRFTLPHGAKITRRFHASDTIGTVKAFLKLHFHEQSIGIERFSLSTSFPKQTYDDESITLEEAGLIPQAVLMVQDLDA